MQLNFRSEITDTEIIKTVIISSGDSKEEIFISFPIEEKDLLTDLADPFVILCVHKMMRTGGDIIINGKISDSLIKNIEIYMNCWVLWLPEEYKPFKIIAETAEDKPEELSLKAVACFSGGLDAAYTVYKHKTLFNTPGAPLNIYDIDKCVMLIGADFPIDSEYEASFKNSQKMLADLNLPLIKVKTNFRQYPHDWDMEYFALFCAACCFYSKTYNYGLIGSDITAKIQYLLLPFTSNPVTNNYLSSNNFKMITDDFYTTRTYKARFVKNWKAGMEHLRVCWASDDTSKNCEKCEKCVRTRLNFMAVGVNELKTMPSKFKVSMINKIKTSDIKSSLVFSVKYYHKDILDYAKKHNTLDKKVIKALEKLIKRNKFKLKHLRTILWFKILRIKFMVMVSNRKKQHYINKLADYKKYYNLAKLPE